MALLTAAQNRYTTKAYDPSRKIDAGIWDELKAALRLSPSSVNSQPWHFLVASTEAGRERIAKAASGSFVYNRPKILNASHVVVFAARRDMDPTHLTAALAQEEADGRFRLDGAKAAQSKTRDLFVDVHRELGDMQDWLRRQVYLSVGVLLWSAALLDVDATPMEGVDITILDEEFGLRERGLAAVLAVALGYHAADDFNAGLPKSRLPEDLVFTEV